MAYYVLNNHDPGIDHRSHSQGNTSQRHHVDRMSGEIEPEHADHQGQRDHEQPRHRRQESPQKHNDYKGDQQRAGHHFVFKVADGIADVTRLIADQGDFRGFRDLTPRLH